MSDTPYRKCPDCGEPESSHWPGIRCFPAAPTESQGVERAQPVEPTTVGEFMQKVYSEAAAQPVERHNPVLDAEPESDDNPSTPSEAKAKLTTEGRTGTANVPTGAQPVEGPRCKYGDPGCPCQDGDLCHYEGENPFPKPSQDQLNAWAAPVEGVERVTDDRPAETREKIFSLKAMEEMLESYTALKERAETRIEVLEAALRAISKIPCVMANPYVQDMARAALAAPSGEQP